MNPILGLELPIIQAPMAGTATPALAAAVSEAGGLGSIGVGATDAEGARAMITELKGRTNRAFNVNLFVHKPANADAAREAAWLDWLAPRFAAYGASPPEALREIYKSFVADEAMLKVLIETRPAVVSFHFGLPPAEAIRALKQAGATLLASATSREEARAAAKAGIDMIVAQGIEAGGHRGIFDPGAPDEGLGTIALTRQLVRDPGLPVIAAGGIMDGAGIAAVLALGATAAQMGTAFVGCPESTADAGYRTALLKADTARTRLTALISGRPARSLSNRFTALEDDATRPPMPDYPIVYDAGKALNAAAKAKGESGFGAQWAGQNAALARAMPAAELMETLRQELKAAAQSLAAYR